MLSLIGSGIHVEEVIREPELASVARRLTPFVRWLSMLEVGESKGRPV